MEDKDDTDLDEALLDCPAFASCLAALPFMLLCLLVFFAGFKLAEDCSNILAGFLPASPAPSRMFFQMLFILEESGFGGGSGVGESGAEDGPMLEVARGGCDNTKSCLLSTFGGPVCALCQCKHCSHFMGPPFGGHMMGQLHSVQEPRCKLCTSLL